MSKRALCLFTGFILVAVLGLGGWQTAGLLPSAITGMISQGTNVTLTGSGTIASPYVINSSGGGGSGSLVLLESHTASSSASLDFTTAFTSTYDEYQIEIIGVVPATSGANLKLLMSTNGGSSYDSSAIYASLGSYYTAAAVGVVGTASQTATQITIADSLATTATAGVNGHLAAYAPLSTTLYKTVNGVVTETSTAPQVVGVTASGTYKNTAAVNAMQFIMSSGNIASGTIRVYGVAH